MKISLKSLKLWIAKPKTAWAGTHASPAASSARASRSLMRNLILLTLSIGIVVFTWQVRTGLYAANGESPDTNPYLQQILKDHSLDALVTKYHSDMNDLFNKNISLMVAALTDEKADAKKVSALFTPPAYNIENGLQTTRKECADSNLSTYCLAISGTKKYFQFRDALLRARTNAQTETIPKGDLNAASSQLINYDQTLENIDTEAERAKQALDQALAAYNEMQFALPMHEKYIEIIKSLEKYRDRVADIRKQIEQFPDTFLNVTTTQCT